MKTFLIRTLPDEDLDILRWVSYKYKVSVHSLILEAIKEFVKKYEEDYNESLR